jgi:hypothetical protein
MMVAAVAASSVVNSRPKSVEGHGRFDFSFVLAIEVNHLAQTLELVVRRNGPEGVRQTRRRIF